MSVAARYGGWYSDLDTVTIASTSHLATTVAMSGDFVSNGNLVFPARHRFLRHLMVQAQNRFTGKGWNSLGWCHKMVLNQLI